jgi:hypothetical protein
VSHVSLVIPHPDLLPQGFCYSRNGWLSFSQAYVQRETSEYPFFFYLLGPRLPDSCFCLSFACVPHVRILPFNVAVSPKSIFTLDLRIAIWNKNMIVVIMASSIWAVNSAFLIQGRCLSFPRFRRPGTHPNLAGSGVSRVKKITFWYLKHRQLILRTVS